jgi:hypothetical protein
MSVKGRITGYCVRVARRPDQQMRLGDRYAGMTSVQRKVQQTWANKKRRQQERREADEQKYDLHR